jgi:hypothetical protein
MVDKPEANVFLMQKIGKSLISDESSRMEIPHHPNYQVGLSNISRTKLTLERLVTSFAFIENLLPLQNPFSFKFLRKKNPS